jgi:hypothetical protein
MPLLQRASRGLFVLAIAALVPFWTIKGTEPSGQVAMWILYGVAIIAACVWLVAAVDTRLRSGVHSVPQLGAPHRDEHQSVAIEIVGGSDLKIENSEFYGFDRAISATDVENLSTDGNVYVGPDRPPRSTDS